MTLKDEYYDHVLGRVTADKKAKRILFAIAADLTDRRGLRQQWEQIDDDIQEEILATWLGFIERETKEES